MVRENQITRQQPKRWRLYKIKNGKGFIEVPYDVQTLSNEMEVQLSVYLAFFFFFLQQKESQTGRKKKEGKKKKKERTDSPLLPVM